MLTISPTLKKPDFSWGKIQGHIPLSAEVFGPAAAMAAEFYADAEAVEFSGDLVGMFNAPAWAPSIDTWLTAEILAEMGFELGKDRSHLVATAGIDGHDDHIHGPVLIWVLHNDGLTFKQGKQSHKTKAGEWFIFDDRKMHSVKESSKNGAYLAWSVPLQFKS